jgi:hypothetical protein
MIGRTDEARGGGGVALLEEFFKRAFGEHVVKLIRIITDHARSRHRKKQRVRGW